MKPKTYPILQLCIENGLAIGWTRAHKHNESPTDDVICAAQLEAIMCEVCELFDMEEANGD